MPFGTLACSAEKRGPLQVGGLPVTCNLTLPVACVAKAASNSAAAGAPQFEYEYSKYSGWPEIKESLMAGRIQAAYMLAPLVMDLADKRIPVKIVSLGHRSGAVIMVRTDSPYQHFRQLAGKRIAIPSRFAVDFLFLRKMLAQEGMTPNDIEIVEMPPPDMPAALYANAVDAYCTGEPFGAAAQRAGYARPLRMTRDEWRNYICCVLTVREELIEENRAAGAGARQPRARRRRCGSTQQQANRDKAVTIAAGRKFFNQDPNILRFVMENPTDRVTYGDLRMIRSGVRGADAAVDRGGHDQASGPVREVRGRELRAQRQAAPSSRCESASDDRASRRCCCLLCAAVRGRGERGADDADAQGRRLRPAARRRPISRCSGSDGARAEAEQLSRQGRDAGLRLHVVARTSARPRSRRWRRRARSSAPAADERPGRLRHRRSRARRRRRACEVSRRLRSDFVGGTGTAEQLAAVRKDYGIVADKHASGDRLRVAHSSYTYLIDREGRLRALMPYGHSRRRLRARRQILLAE